jgi:HK97 gp10 family phage protein
MIDIESSVTGAPQVVAHLESIPDSIRARLRAALPELGGEVRDRAAALAPQRHSGKTSRYGPLRAKINAKFRERAGELVEKVSLGTAFYGRFQETGLDVMRRSRRVRGIVGVRTRLTKSGTVLVSARKGFLRRETQASTPFHLPAHPFMHPAFESLQGRIEERIRAAVTEAVKT